MALTLDTTIIEPIFENIDDEMKQSKRWVGWRTEKRTNKKTGKVEFTKVPYQPNGMKAEADNPNTWSTYEDVKQAYETKKTDGIGFMLGDGYIGIDVDECIDEDGSISETAKFILSNVDSYYEKSVSGTGIHVIVKGTIPFLYIEEGKTGRKVKRPDPQTKEIELYRERRFFTITGETKNPKPLNNDQTGLINVLDKYFKKEKVRSTSSNPQRGEQLNMSNSELWEKMFNSKNGQGIKALYNGDLSNHGNDHSAADVALCNYLAFWTNKDPFQMDSMFRESGLMRYQSDDPQKYWDRKTGNTTYGQLTIEKAIEGCSNVYTPNRSGSFNLLLNDELLDFSKKEEVDWRSKLEYGVTKNGDQYLLKNARNIELILENCIADKVAYNQFSQTEIVLKNLPWRKAEKQDEWKDADISQLLHWMDAKWDMMGKDKILNAFVHVIHRRSFHPIKEYLESTVWDGELRIPYLFHNFLGVEDNSFNREISIRWFVGAVKRIYQPGCKHDWGIVLVGQKDIGKSWIVQKITPFDAFGELTDFDAKKGGEQLRGKWILEIPELSAKHKSNNEEMKAFMSRQSDDYRAAYARKTESRPRQCVFIGTTNKTEFITDETGDRRNVPLVCRKEIIKMDISKDLTDEFIVQLWAEAKVYFDEGKESYLDKQLSKQLDEINNSHTVVDPLQDEVLAYAESIHESGRKHLCVREIWDHVVTNDPKNKPSRKDSERIVAMLTALEYERLDKKQRCGEYGVRDAYRQKQQD